jgi:Flp pilus assembly pilin Flp
MVRQIKAAMFVQEQEGQGLVEYALILLLVSIACILALTSLGAALVNMIQAVTAAF